MNQEVDRAPLVFQRLETGIHRGFVGDIGGDHERIAAKAFNQRPDAALEFLALIGKGQLGALGGQLLGNPPGDGILVGDAHDKPALALHQCPGRELDITHLVSPRL